MTSTTKGVITMQIPRDRQPVVLERTVRLREMALRTSVALSMGVVVAAILLLVIEWADPVRDVSIATSYAARAGMVATVFAAGLAALAYLAGRWSRQLQPQAVTR